MPETEKRVKMKNAKKARLLFLAGLRIAVVAPSRLISSDASPIGGLVRLGVFQIHTPVKIHTLSSVIPSNVGLFCGIVRHAKTAWLLGFNFSATRAFEHCEYLAYGLQRGIAMMRNGADGVRNENH